MENNDMGNNDIRAASIVATASHVRSVQTWMQEVIADLMTRMIRHDSSKFGPEEEPTISHYTPLLSGQTYNSDEYKATLAKMKPALDHHYDKNDHHPEHFPNGIKDMNLMQLLELLCDWKSSSSRHPNGSLARSLVINQKRFGYSSELRDLLARTAISLGMISNEEWESVLPSE